jgi:hypothetical protein
MRGYQLSLLKDMVVELGERKTQVILSQFSCPLNRDVEAFLHNNAIEFAKQGIASTHLVSAFHRDKPVIIGYFTLANKNIIVSNNSMSNTQRKRINKFGVYDPDRKGYRIAAPLIAQLGKNYSNGYDKLITGDELLLLACQQVAQVQEIIGGKFVYLECEDNLKLIDFYASNGFVNFGIRQLDKDEKDLFEGNFLIQMLRYL